MAYTLRVEGAVQRASSVPILEATLTDEHGEVVATTVGTYQLRRFG
jgi:hypothetical protein